MFHSKYVMFVICLSVCLRDNLGTDSIDDLTTLIFIRLKEIENGLREMAEKQGMQLDELNELIAENKRINKEMKVCMSYIIVNYILKSYIHTYIHT